MSDAYEKMTAFINSCWVKQHITLGGKDILMDLLNELVGFEDKDYEVPNPDAPQIEPPESMNSMAMSLITTHDEEDEQKMNDRMSESICIIDDCEEKKCYN